MPRQARLDAPGTLHHVIARGIERRKIFLAEDDYEAFVQRLERVLSGSGSRVLAWSLLRNHFHLLLRSGDSGLPSIMRRLMTGYVVTFNRRHRRHGHLFQNRYKSIVCEEEPYLLELVRYIHLNPVRARIVKTVEDLGEYPYSGHAALMGKTSGSWQSVEEVLGHFGSDLESARERYQAFVEAGLRQGRRPDLVGGGLRRSHGRGEVVTRRRNREEATAYDERILGGSEFVSQVLRDAEWERREILRRSRRGLGVGDLAQRTAELAGLSVEELCSASRKASIVAARRALAQVAVSELGYPGSVVAKYLGVAASTINRSVTQGKGNPLAARLLAAIEES